MAGGKSVGQALVGWAESCRLTKQAAALPAAESPGPLAWTAGGRELTQPGCLGGLLGNGKVDRKKRTFGPRLTQAPPAPAPLWPGIFKFERNVKMMATELPEAEH